MHELAMANVLTQHILLLLRHRPYVLSLVFDKLSSSKPCNRNIFGAGSVFDLKSSSRQRIYK